MEPSVRAAFVSLFAVLTLAAPGFADVFTVRGVEVDETAASAAAARQQAIQVGQQLAAQRLIERLTLAEDRAFAPPIDPGRVAPLVSGYQVEEEALAGPRYIGRLTVSFNSDAVRDLLEEFGIPYVVSSARPAVVVPLWRAGEETRLWGSDNPWLEAWSIAGTVDELVPVIGPSGDLADISLIDAARAITLDRAALEALAANYGSARALVALASPAPGTEGLLTTRMVGIDFANGGQQADYGSLGPLEPVALARAAAALLQDSWKRTMTVREPDVTTAEVSVLFASVADWMELQSVIASEPLVQLARLDALTNDGALMTIEHLGRQDQLALVLREHGATLFEAPNGLVITTVAGATDLQRGP
jgi:hypothetical protein